MIRFYYCVPIYFTVSLTPYVYYDIYVFLWMTFTEMQFCIQIRQLHVSWFLLMSSNLGNSNIMKAIELWLTSS